MVLSVNSFQALSETPEVLVPGTNTNLWLAAEVPALGPNKAPRASQITSSGKREQIIDKSDRLEEKIGWLNKGTTSFRKHRSRNWLLGKSGFTLWAPASLILLAALGIERLHAGTPATNGPPAVEMSVSVFGDQQHFALADRSGNVGQQHFAYLDSSGHVEDAFYDGSKWHLQKINDGGATSGPPAASNLFVSVFGDQQHFAYLDRSGNVEDAFFDRGSNNWHLQKINDGGATSAPPAAGNLFVSVFGDQQHFAYCDKAGNLEDPFYIRGSNNWHLQKINDGGATSGPPAAGNLFVSVFGEQQHFAYLDRSGNVEDAFFDRGSNNWHLQKINDGGATSGPPAANPPAAGNLFVSVFGDQQHFAYCDEAGNLEDPFYIRGSNSWHLQKVNNGGNTPGLPVVGQVFVSVYQDQQHFAYTDYRDVLQDAFYDRGSNSWSLQQLTTGNSTVTSSVPIQYVVMDVLYAPPGSSATGVKNSATYGTTTALGTSSSTTSSFKEGFEISADAQAFGSGASATFGESQDNTNTSEMDITNSSSFSITVNGPSQDGINHDLDEIWLILNPVVELSVTGKNIAWALSNSGTVAEVQIVTVGMLKNPQTMPIPPGTAAALSRAGITAADYPKLLARDPFANGNTHIDTTRFVPTNTSFPYELASTAENYTAKNDLTNKSSNSTTSTDIINVTIKTGFDVGVVKANLSNTDSFTWTNTSTYGTTTESTQQASATIAGPSTNWTGGNNVDVYYDRIYSSFMYAYDPNSVPAIREKMASVKGTVTSSNKPVAHEEVLLTAGGQKFRTYTNSQGVYYFYNKPHGSASISVRRVAHPISIGVTTVLENRELGSGLKPIHP
jgi:hypothetical protein